MKKFAACALLVLATTCLIPNSIAQSRDGFRQEQAEEEALGNCIADAQCRKILEREKQREKAAQAKYDAKPFEEKLFPWIVIFIAGWAIWKWAGRK